MYDGLLCLHILCKFVNDTKSIINKRCVVVVRRFIANKLKIVGTRGHPFVYDVFFYKIAYA